MLPILVALFGCALLAWFKYFVNLPATPAVLMKRSLSSTTNNIPARASSQPKVRVIGLARMLWWTYLAAMMPTVQGAACSVANSLQANDGA
jgi:hypothetical protein